MAVIKGSLFMIDNIITILSGNGAPGQSMVFGPLDGNYRINEIVVNGNTNAIPVFEVGSLNTAGAFVATSTFANGLDNAGAVLGATTTALQTGTSIAWTVGTALSRGQYIRVSNAAAVLARDVVRYSLRLETAVGTISGSGYPVETTPAV